MVALALSVGEMVRVAQHEAGEPARRHRRAIALDAALVDVPDEQIHASGVAQGFDLAEQLKIADGGFLLTAASQVVSVRVDQRLPVLRSTLQPFGFADSGVAFDRVERHVQPAAAFE